MSDPSSAAQSGVPLGAVMSDPSSAAQASSCGTLVALPEHPTVFHRNERVRVYFGEKYGWCPGSVIEVQQQLGELPRRRSAVMGAVGRRERAHMTLTSVRVLYDDGEKSWVTPDTGEWRIERLGAEDDDGFSNGGGTLERVELVCLIERSRLLEPARGTHCRHAPSVNAAPLRSWVQQRRCCPVSICGARLACRDIVSDDALCAQLAKLAREQPRLTEVWVHAGTRVLTERPHGSTADGRGRAAVGGGSCAGRGGCHGGRAGAVEVIECVDSPETSASAESVRAHPEHEVIDCINSPLDDDDDEEEEEEEEEKEEEEEEEEGEEDEEEDEGTIPSTGTFDPSQVVNEAAATATAATTTAATTAAATAAAAAGGCAQHGMWRCVDEPRLSGTCMRDPVPPAAATAAATAAAASAIHHRYGSSSELMTAPPREQQQQRQRQQRSVLPAPTAVAAAAVPKRRRDENEPAHETVAEESHETNGGRSKRATQLPRRSVPAACEAARSGAARAASVICSALRSRGATADDSIELDAD